MSLPKDFIKEKSDDKYSILNASKYDDEDTSNQQLKLDIQDDWSFSMFTNEDYINEMINSNKIESTSSMMFDDFNLHIKEKSYLLGIGDCISYIYSGSYKSNGVRITNHVIQFIKNNKLYTLIGSSLPESLVRITKTF